LFAAKGDGGKQHRGALSNGTAGRHRQCLVKIPASPAHLVDGLLEVLLDVPMAQRLGILTPGRQRTAGASGTHRPPGDARTRRRRPSN